MPLPVVLDTDIGTDIDDAYALVLAATSPELDLLAVTTVNNDVALRARIAKKVLRLLGRPDVPVTTGYGPSLTPGVTRGWDGREGRGIDLSDIEPARDFAGGTLADALSRAIAAAESRGTLLTLITIGPLTNAARMLDDLPHHSIRRIGRIVAMASNFQGFGEANARGEHNVACDAVAMERVLGSGIPVTLIGLNVTMQTRMTGAQVAAIESVGSPLAEALVGMHRSWFDIIQRDHSPMHDPLAVAVAFRPDLVTLQPVAAEVRHDAPEPGTVVYNPPQPDEVTSIQIATSVNADAFHRLFEERIMAAVKREA